MLSYLAKNSGLLENISIGSAAGKSSGFGLKMKTAISLILNIIRQCFLALKD